MAEAGNNYFDSIAKGSLTGALGVLRVAHSRHHPSGCRTGQLLRGLDMVFLLKRPTQVRQTPVFNLQWHRARATAQSH